MTRNELLEMKKQIDSEYKADIGAVNQLLKRFPEKEDKTIPFVQMAEDGDKPIFGLVQALVKAQPAQFSLNEIVALVENGTGEQPNRQTVSTALFRLKEDGKIKVVQKAQGRRPAIYEKISPAV